MYWKLRAKAFSESAGDVARQIQASAVRSGTVPGLLAYQDGEPVGWVAVEPRSAYPRLAHSRNLKPLDNAEVWSVTCFFVAKQARRQALTIALLEAAVEHVRRHGGRIVEGYPIDAQGEMPAPFVFTGLVSVFRKAGFREVARRSEKRPIFRFVID
jgi:GNAT superfamily N-acetyltransferase